MLSRFEQHVADIEQRLQHEAGLVDDALGMALEAFVEGDPRLAGRVVDGDHAINHAEVEIERLCFDTMALQGPVASDLRFLTGALKINSDLERVGDLACSIAKTTWRQSTVPESAFAAGITDLSEDVREMLQEAVRSCIDRDAQAARDVWARDRAIDVRYLELTESALQRLKDGCCTVEDATLHASVARNIERVGDHATNIAEDVVFIVEGNIVRHNVEARIAPRPPASI